MLWKSTWDKSSLGERLQRLNVIQSTYLKIINIYFILFRLVDRPKEATKKKFILTESLMKEKNPHKISKTLQWRNMATFLARGIT